MRKSIQISFIAVVMILFLGNSRSASAVQTESITTNNGKEIVIDYTNQTVTFEDGITEDGDFLFNDRVCLPKEYTLVLPASLKDISISGYNGVKEIKLDPNNPNFVVKDGVMYNKQMTKVYMITKSVHTLTLPADAQSFEFYTSGFYNVKNLFISKACKNISFPVNTSNYLLEAVQIEDGNLNYAVVDNCIYDKNKTELYFCPGYGSGNKLLLPDSVKKISFTVLDGNQRIQSITLSKQLKTIDTIYRANEMKNLKEIKIPASNQTFLAKNGVLYNKKKTQVLIYPSAKKDKKYTVPATVTSIALGGDGLSENQYLETLNLPEKLKKFTSPIRVAEVFPKLKQIKISNKNKYYTQAGGVLYNKNKTELKCFPPKLAKTSYRFPETLKKFDEEYLYDTNVKKLYLGKDLKNWKSYKDKIGYTYDNQLESFQVAAKNKHYSAKDGILYDKKKKSIKSVPSKYKATKITIPDSVTTINGSLRGSKVKKLTVGKNIKKFNGIDLPKLEQVVLSSKNPYFKMKDQVLYNKKIDHIVLFPANRKSTVYSMPNTVKTGELSANQNLQSLVIGKSYEDIRKVEDRVIQDDLKNDPYLKEVHPFFTKLKEIKVNEDNPYYVSRDGVLYTKNMVTLLWYPEAKTNEEFLIPMETTSMSRCDNFLFNTYLKDITVESGNHTFEFANGVLYHKGTDLYMNDLIVAVVGGLPYENITIPDNVIDIQVDLNRFKDKIGTISIMEGNKNFYLENGILYKRYFD